VDAFQLPRQPPWGWASSARGVPHGGDISGREWLRGRDAASVLLYDAWESGRLSRALNMGMCRGLNLYWESQLCPLVDAWPGAYAPLYIGRDDRQPREVTGGRRSRLCSVILEPGVVALRPAGATPGPGRWDSPCWLAQLPAFCLPSPNPGRPPCDQDRRLSLVLLDAVIGATWGASTVRSSDRACISSLARLFAVT
jgi:hypothetical protein